MTTSADAYFRGFKVIVPEDCIGSTQVENKVWAVEWLRKYIGQITTSNQLVAEISISLEIDVFFC